MNWITELEDGATLVTASDRLSRHLHQHYADYQLAAGRQAWARPDILPQAAFWRRLFETLQEDDLSDVHLLTRLPMSAWWEQAVSDTFTAQPLLQAAGAARSALDAWQLAVDWQLDPARLETDFLDEARHLHQWGSRFEQACEQHGWVPEYRLADHVLAILAGMAPRHREHLLPRRLRLAGFLEFTPRQDAQWRALADCGTEVTTQPLPAVRGEARRLECADARDEHRRIANWAKHRLQENPRQRIGIVVPKLEERRDELRRQLLDALAPGWLPTFSDQPLPFNFSLGEPLAEQPLVRTALDWLAMLETDAIEFPVAARIARSPYLAPAGEFPARFALEAALRDRGYAECSLRDWAYLARRGECPELAASIEASRDAFREARRSGRKLPSAWARAASEWLEAARWCHVAARTLDSHEYQARDAFTGLFGRLAELDDTLGNVNFSTAFGWLRRLAGETLFQPRAADAPVQVLGLFEATGMSFDALWIAGMDDETLPAAPQPNPFLPLHLQREHRMPQSSATREQEFARHLFNGLLGAAPEINGSFAKMDGDAERRMSPLLESLPEPDAGPIDAMSGIAAEWLATAPLESFSDETAPRYAQSDAAGGTGLLEDQSHCPFRAFAIHRLAAADWPTPEPGPDARIRGSVLHEILDGLWRRWRTRDELARRYASGELETDIRAAVDAVLNESLRKHRHRWRDSLVNIERTRLAGMLFRWVERIELERPDFSVMEIEGTPSGKPPPQDYHDALTPVQAGPLALRGKLDRVDRLADGSELVIDYKSGKAPSPGQFFGSRPQSPQLPAYVLARRQSGHETPAGIAVASLKAGEEGMRGVMKTADADAKVSGINGITPIGRNRSITDWDEAVASWEDTIAQLGEAFVAGHAAVDPLPRACDYCHLPTLCRIHEIRHADALDGEDVVDEEDGDD